METKQGRKGATKTEKKGGTRKGDDNKKMDVWEEGKKEDVKMLKRKEGKNK